MAKNIIGDAPCPECRKKGSDSTGNHLMLFKDGGAYCNRCGHATNWKEKDIKPQERVELTDAQVNEQLKEFLSCDIKAWPKRKLKKAALERYGCRVGVSPTDRNSVGSYLVPYHDESLKLCGYKVRLADEKRFWNQGRPKEAVLFGQQLVNKGGGKKLFITESPIDAVSLYQAIKDSWAKSKFASAEPNVVGLPHGTGCAVDVLTEQTSLLDKFSEIILVMDSDEAGRKCVEEVASILPHVKYVTLPEGQDPNQMLMDGKSDELAKLAMFSSVEYVMSGMTDIYDLVNEIIEPPKHGISYPFASMTKLTYGLHTQQIIGFAGGVGMGKSDVKNQIIAHLATEHKLKQTVFDLEYSAVKSGRLLASKVGKKPYHKPDCGATQEEIQAALLPLKGLVTLCTHRGSRDWNEIKAYMRRDVLRGSKLVYLDPITALVAHLGSSEANDMLNNIFADISAMTQELDFSVIYFAHLNPPKTGANHERGGKVLESQMTGSRAMMKWSNYIWGIEGSKDSDIPEHERNTRKIVMLKDREYGNVGNFFLHYDPETTQLSERW
jgi:twinkle protein